MTAEAIDALGHIDILVNNAGTCITASRGSSPTSSGTPCPTSTSKRCERDHCRWVLTCENGVRFGGEHRIDIGDHREPTADATRLQRVEGGGAPPHQIPCRRVAPLGIRVNALAPGYVKTKMAPVDRPDLQRYWIDDAPQQRYALPEVVAPSVVFLASDAASFITGRSSSGRWGVHRMVSTHSTRRQPAASRSTRSTT